MAERQNITMDDEVIENWIRYHAEKRKASDPTFSAVEEVDSVIDVDPEAAWEVVLQLVEAAPDDWVLANIAAGPLEALICKSTELVIERVELQARRDPKFRRCLTGVWISSLRPEMQARITKYTSTIKDPL